ncbi:MAG: rhodanese-like domain-containing protein [Candidatus Eisenbacteria bacterium]|nr:rhodanese-like domain-containing protein [Candidatus Latescibacterota bacterium]MBD3303049.1 rhodanese-like domain-containing protein [Candidatus Eisenbacteria bacterium]
MKKLSTEELMDLRRKHGDDGVTIVNVLKDTVFAKEHIPGSVNVPLKADDFARRVEKEAGGKEKPIVVHDADDTCDGSQQAARTLEDAGFREVYDYDGGIKDWREAGHPTEGSR